MVNARDLTNTSINSLKVVSDILHCIFLLTLLINMCVDFNLHMFPVDVSKPLIYQGHVLIININN